ncbi:MAG: dihydroneopterin aldolase [Chthoniobacterales bacterium]
MKDHDWIEIRGQRVATHIGVPEAERAGPQQLLVDLRMQPLRNFSRMPDEINATVDYFAVSQRIAALAAEKPRQLIERLADDIAAAVLKEFAVKRVEVTVRKFILPETEHVAVHCSRERNH